jgi:hypothetical protein
MYVFRDGRYAVRGCELVGALLAELRALPSHATENSCLAALLRAGELECALADSPAPPAGEGSLLHAVAGITDWLAQRFVGREESCDIEHWLRVLEAVSAPDVLHLSRPEGFAYYGLHPRDYALSAPNLPDGRPAAVVGIRSIGSTLSAITAASLRARGCRASRITVRPGGDPFNRETIFSPEEVAWVANNLAAQAKFLVVDEGPGLSGSSFLSVGEALVKAGVRRGDITFLCARLPNPETLRARDGARRWQSFKTMDLTSSQQRPPDAEEWIGAGEWRRRLTGSDWLASGNYAAASEWATESNWPASWTQMERPKFLSRDHRILYKFEGLGHYGAAVKERARILAQRGFAPAVLDHDLSSGYLGYQLLQAQPMAAREASQDVLERLASYLAVRVEEFSQDQVSDASSPRAQGEVSLPKMCQVNAREEFGIELPPPWFELRRRVIADGRMLPHEWLRVARGELLKTDGVSHGDDHFFPGPCDIAWDLAGTMVEWELPAGASEYLLERYHRLSGDEARPRLASYRLAYSLFRMGYCKMAAEAMQGSPEAIRLQSAYRSYRRVAEQQLSQRAAA